MHDVQKSLVVFMGMFAEGKMFKESISELNNQGYVYIKNYWTLQHISYHFI